MAGEGGKKRAGTASKKARGGDKTAPQRRIRGLLGRFRLRTKLAASLSIAALLPVFVASSVAVSVVLRSLDRGLTKETERQLHVGVNLMLRNVERLGHEADRLSSAGDLSRAMTTGTEEINMFLARESPHLPSSLVQITDERGRIMAERIVGGVENRFDGLRVGPKSPSVRAALSFERSVTIVRVGDALVVRAVAPIVDDSFMLQGAVIVSVPLDGEFADGVKGALGTDVLLFVGFEGDTRAARSTFLNDKGGRHVGIMRTVGVAERLASGGAVITKDEINDREYSLGYTTLSNLKGQHVGMFAVAVDRAPIVSAKSAATRSLALGAAGAFVFALGLAGLLSRRITRPVSRLHRGAIAIARGDLDHRISVTDADEIGDLADAFNHMTKALKENQKRLAARMREIVALHDAGRAVSSSINQDQVARKVVDSVARVFDVRLCALWTSRNPDSTAGEPVDLQLGAARAKRSDVRSTLRGDEGVQLAEPLESIAREVAMARATLRVDRVADDPNRREAALAAGVTGSLLATPLERKGSVVGVIVVGRARDARAFSEADSNLLATFADQAATAIENARLYGEVKDFSEELEAKVRMRTTELTAINAELGRTITELRETQSQLILSERLAGLGLLVAGVAHEINSPSAAIRGSVDALADNVARLADRSHRLADVELDDEGSRLLVELVREQGPVLAAHRMPSPARARVAARALRPSLEEAGMDEAAATEAARELAQVGVDEELVQRMMPLFERSGHSESGGETGTSVIIGYLMEYVYLHRNALTIRHAIKQIQRIVGALKSYSHLDQEAGLVEADIHDGIEDTLVILDYGLRGIDVTRKFADLPRIPVHLDELNQVWTNLIHNASQAMQGEGNITVETGMRDDGIVVRVIDGGPGIPIELQNRIFEPFFTTKPKGEGTGLGLGIVKQIVDKHHGTVTCESEPGRTCFEVWLPLHQKRSNRDAARPGTSDDTDADTDGDRPEQVVS